MASDDQSSSRQQSIVDSEIKGSVSLRSVLRQDELALELAAACCGTLSWSPDQYLARFSALEQTTGTSQSDLTAFELSLTSAVVLAPQADLIASLLAVMASAPVRDDLFHDGVMSEVDREAAIDALARLSLITRQRKEDGKSQLIMRSEIQELARGRLAALGAFEEAQASAVLLLAVDFPAEADRDRYDGDHLLPHVAALAEAPSHLADVDDDEWLQYRKTSLMEWQQRRKKAQAELAEFDALYEAFCSYREKCESAEFLARNLGRLGREQQINVLRHAFEFSSNPITQALRDVFETLSRELQTEVRYLVQQSKLLVDTLRSHLAADDKARLEVLVADRLKEFPTDLQDDLEQAFGKRELRDSFMERAHDRQRRGAATAQLRAKLGVEKLQAAMPELKAPPKPWWKRWISKDDKNDK